MNTKLLLCTKSILSVIPKYSIPRGVLYAAVIGHMSLDDFHHVLHSLEEAGGITFESHQRITRGPKWQETLDYLKSQTKRLEVS